MDFSEAKASLVAVVQGLERGLLKARRGVEADKPLHDLAPLFEAVRLATDKMRSAGTDYERAVARRERRRESFMQKKGAYLNGLHKHVLGESGGEASKTIFKRSAYVADTFNRMTNMRGVL